MTAKRGAQPTVAEVAPAVPLTGGRATYPYRLPKKLTIFPLSAVTIPFGPRHVHGIVLKLHRRTPRHALKSITAVMATRLTQKQLQFGEWITRTMHGSLGFTLRLFLPPASSKRRSNPVAPGSRQRPHGALRGYLTPETKQYLHALKKTDAALIESDPTERRALIQTIVAAYVRQTKQSALILVPEKALLSHYVGLPAVTGDLKPSRLASIWHGVSTGAIQALVGTQKALFLPFQNIGLIVVEEEAWPTHKLWDQYPRLHNVDAAQALAALHGVRILWSGSFPSVRLYAAHKDKSLPTPVWNPAVLRPEVHLFSHNDRAKKSLLPFSFIDTLRQHLAKQQPTLVLYNRQDQRAKELRHLFHHAFGKNFSYLTFATTAVFAEVAPANFATVAWLFPESTFTYPDFRSEERGLITLSRLQQLVPVGQKIHIATRSLTLAQRLLQWKPLDWYDTLLRERRALGYPPCADAVKLTVAEKTQARAQRRAEKLRQTLEKRIQQSDPSARIQGPFTALTVEPRKTASYQHLLLFGDAAILPDLYQDLKIDSVDLSPHRIL